MARAGRTSGNDWKSDVFVLDLGCRTSGKCQSFDGSRGTERPRNHRSSDGSGSTRDLSSGTQFWAEIGDFRVKIERILQIELGKKMGKS